ncbi:single-stranded-DNA-specific exonuclease RecJ [Pseudobacteriovorax antillogorgiicola]|uniref:Single-stranded-DNA-specific exonuclease RecJ n=1 Tax=Pseudobacteriovorax antillogorgiicola TaxID=1513793 RepID=A0A1Y6CHN8_9BACT|nr:DHH family phosphoesterase [Pseudobacteriovorax antillogorgiicola]TCS48605.1 single-stranded-DNA-specific exonuclease RecJ [Pseudobacteriovorax antillogorgiicola]SMF55532.1 single-stranded-DNA-specific exonuclease RecJ [Pseudobacteriovorax antillogorgiicola]
MGKKFQLWQPRSTDCPESFSHLANIVKDNRKFEEIVQLNYGDHGLQDALDSITRAIKENKRIALYADYDVDGTMSCVSWIWFLKAIGYDNVLHYIPCRFEEGYGLNLDAVKHLIHEEKAELIITMDTGITANVEAAYCRNQGVEFICTDHHKIQQDKMPDCVILNPKLHPEEAYQELCGCGITFVLLRQLGREFPISSLVWNDILALVGMATICDVVPLNGVNHKLANLGVQALFRSQRPVLKEILRACSIGDQIDEKDVGFRIGPRINAVGRLKHADLVIQAFIDENPGDLIKYMGQCNEERKLIQAKIVEEAHHEAQKYDNDRVLFLGGDWHSGVVGIAASKIAEAYWRPTWMFGRKDGMCKGSARSIPGFDVTLAMQAVGELFAKFGGHAAAGGFSFPEEREPEIRMALNRYAEDIYESLPDIWQSKIHYDCELPLDLANLKLADELSNMKPFGHGFEEPKFTLQADIRNVVFYRDKITGEPKHTAVTIHHPFGSQKIMFFNEVHEELEFTKTARFIVSASKNTFRGTTSLSLMGVDWESVC